MRLTATRGFIRFLFGLFLALSISSCQTVQQDVVVITPNHHKPAEARISRDWYHTVPDCVMVMPLSGSSSVLAERALAAQISPLFARTVGADEIRMLEQSLGVNIREAAGFRLVGEKAACRHTLLAEIAGAAGPAYHLIHAEVSVTVMLSLVTSLEEDHVPLWQVRAERNRSDGGLPLSALSAASAVYRAGRLASDPEVVPSVLGDALRAAIHPIPNLRAVQTGPYQTSRNSTVRPSSLRQ